MNNISITFKITINIIQCPLLSWNCFWYNLGYLLWYKTTLVFFLFLLHIYIKPDTRFVPLFITYIYVCVYIYIYTHTYSYTYTHIYIHVYSPRRCSKVFYTLTLCSSKICYASPLTFENLCRRHRPAHRYARRNMLTWPEGRGRWTRTREHSLLLCFVLLVKLPAKLLKMFSCVRVKLFICARVCACAVLRAPRCSVFTMRARRLTSQCVTQRGLKYL
jgi:hypothetical protein